MDEELERRVRQIGEELRGGERMGEGKERGGWWDEDCEEKRRKVRRVLREWRRKRGGGE